MADNLQVSFDQLAAERDALRRFIADASHELRTPVTALKNFNTLLLDSATDDPAAREEFLSESQAQIQRLEWITHNLLDLSRLDAGLLELDLVENDLGEIIETAACHFQPLADGKGVSLLTRLSDTPIILLSDRMRLEIALTNLLDNALKFTPTGGEVAVSLERAADRVLLRVYDTGVGIPPEDMPHIFERFYRGRGHNAEGSGLGLAIVKSIVEAHGGQVSVESSAGEGTAFTLIFLIE
jgi:signal transduction histidine kinase